MNNVPHDASVHGVLVHFEIRRIHDHGVELAIIGWIEKRSGAEDGRCGIKNKILLMHHVPGRMPSRSKGLTATLHGFMKKGQNAWIVLKEVKFQVPRESKRK
ncbi:MAG TPA: hypothetical protein VM120_17870 [Bryobacteraceae bacterium]|nr:hypothetical protein [Bryobacteraceae bacterium]